jgi:ABC-2 type transport system permease protein
VRLNQMDAGLGEVSHELWTLVALLVVYGGLAVWRLGARRSN